MLQNIGFEAALNQAPVGFSMVDRDFRYLTVNDTMAQLNGLAPELHIGRTIYEIQPDLATALGPSLQQLFSSGGSLRQVEIRGKSPRDAGCLYTWIVNADPALSDDGAVELVLITALDVTRQKDREESLLEALSHQEIGFLEQGHRISQGLQVIYNALLLEAGHSTEAGVRTAFESASRRLHALNVIHCQLQRPITYWEPPDAKEFLCGLCDDLAAAFVSGDRTHCILLDCKSGINISHGKMLSLGIIVSELVTNAYQYAYSSGQSDVGIHLSLRRGQEHQAQLIVSDDGKGLHQRLDTRTIAGLSMKIVQAQVHQLRGALYDDRTAHGARVTVSFPLDDWPSSSDARASL